MSDIIGAKVSIPGASGSGIVRYIGPIQGKTGTFAGVELLGTLATTRGKNSGAVDGIQYFQVDMPKSGLFLPYDRLKSVNPSLGSSRVSSRSPLTPINNRSYQNARVSMINENLARSEDLSLKYESEIAELQRSLREKEKRLENFNNQREEWRAAMDELVAVQQDGIQVFEEKIHELEQENAFHQNELKKANDALGVANRKIEELERTIENMLSDKVSSVDIDDKQKEIDQLKRELESRPHLEDLEEVQSSLEELETIYQKRLDEKDGIIARLQNEVETLQEDLKATPDVTPSASVNNTNNNNNNNNNFKNTSNNTSGGLPIYRAMNPIDPSQGKNDWCGLCERDGHSSINCPYENEVF
ncbi:Nuclear fusion protein, putative (Microtubule-associated protein, putative), partial [Candida maltosa Xu316]